MNVVNFYIKIWSNKSLPTAGSNNIAKCTLLIMTQI